MNLFLPQANIVQFFNRKFCEGIEASPESDPVSFIDQLVDKCELAASGLLDKFSWLDVRKILEAIDAYWLTRLTLSNTPMLQMALDANRVHRYLVELAAQKSHYSYEDKDERVGANEMAFIVAIVKNLMQSRLIRTTIHYSKNFPELMSLRFSQEGELEFNGILQDVTFEAIKKSDRWRWQSCPEFSEEFDTAFLEETGIEFELYADMNGRFKSIVRALDFPGIVNMDLVKTLSAHARFSTEVVEKFLSYHTFDPELRADYNHQVSRPNSILYSPFIRLDRSSDNLVYSFASYEKGLESFIGSLEKLELNPNQMRSEGMKKFISRMRKTRETEFENEAFNTASKYLTHCYREFGFLDIGPKQERSGLGKVDTFAIDPKSKKIVLIECKFLNQRSIEAHETATILNNWFFDSRSNGKPDNHHYHWNKRHRFVEDYLPETLDCMKLDKSVEWSVKTVVVTDHVTPIQFLPTFSSNEKYEIVDYTSFEERLKSGWIYR